MGEEAASHPNSPRLTRLAGALFATTTFGFAYLGWRLFYFITDDAYIAFRYVSNSMLGRGLVWNPAPFRPVEGYTSFLWVMLLKGVWQLTGLEPPDCANALSFLFAAGTLYLAYRFVWRMKLPPSLVRWRWAFVAFVLAGTLTNRTFLAWMSSGLETACFNFLLTWWLYEAMAREGRERQTWIFRLSLAAALSALCRPDGLLFVLATLVILALKRPRSSALASTFPLLAVPIHLLWRHAFYGFWLPNTYYAKYVGAWPASGLRYLGSFVLEYGVWFWALLALAALARATWRSRLVVPIGALLIHSAYYTFIIGGDHFEYRVYSHWVPLLFVSAVWFATRWERRRWLVPSALAGFLVVSWPIPWVHWWETKDLYAPDRTHMLIQPIAPDFPMPIRPVVEVWDGWQAWLISHFVCIRHQEHKAFFLWLDGMYPQRADGSALPWEDRDVVSAGSVGLLSWALPNVAVIDEHGLNDPVVARTPRNTTGGDERLMAHDRDPPPGYVACFAPNVKLSASNELLVSKRALSDATIRDCESRVWGPSR